MSTESEHSQFKEAIPKRDQAREHVRELIRKGAVQGKGYLPSVRKAADLMGLNRDAIWRAYLDLEREGYIRQAPNRRFEINPGNGAADLRALNVRVITVGAECIRFSGLQRFYRTLLNQGSQLRIQPHLKCAMDASQVAPEWMEGMDGVILAGYFGQYELLEPLTRQIPRIGVITPQAWKTDYTIDSDNQQIGALAAEHLLQTGATAPCVISYATPHGRHSLRNLGFQAKWIEEGGDLDHFNEHWIDPRNNYKRVIELERIARSLDSHDAVFCLDKESAIDLLSIFDCNGISVPDDIRVVSVDGTFESQGTKPKLTFVKQRFEEMAIMAAEQMRLLCSESPDPIEPSEKRKTLVPAELVLRESA